MGLLSVLLLILLGLLCLAALAAWLLRFQLHVDVEFPGTVSGQSSISFLRFRREFPLFPQDSAPEASANDLDPPFGSPTIGALPSPTPSVNPVEATRSPSPGQDGFLRLPASGMPWKERARRAGFQCATDPRLLRGLASYMFRTVVRLFRFPGVHLSIRRLELGHPDPYVLGKAAAVIAAGGVLAPFLWTVPVAYRFDRYAFSMRSEISAGFSLLKLMGLGLVLLLTFPWYRLLIRFAGGMWRPELQGWRSMVYRRLTSNDETGVEGAELSGKLP